MVCAAENQRRNLLLPKVRERRRNWMKRWRQDNPEKYLEILARWLDANKEKERERGRLASAKRFRQNPEKWRAANRKSAEKHREKRRAASRAYSKTAAGRAADTASKHKRRAAKKAYCGKNASGNEITALLAISSRCPDCGQAYGKTIKKHIDHVIPLSRGVDGSITNLRIVCASCNQKKHASVFASSGQGFLL